jgi:phosphopantothenoylcysteine decarboxylase/phosphopantothenate--cysteine ligase
MDRGATVQVAMTRAATAFIQPLTFQSITGRRVLLDLFEGSDQIEHVERAHEADLIVIAPASANTIAELAHGLADDAVTATALASRAPLLVAPAMETGMWENGATQANVGILRSRGVHVIGPADGKLASGRSGTGRMVEPLAIAGEALLLLGPKDLAGLHVLITAGPTWEPIDPVRILTNRSTGSMGIALAASARRRGARVTLVLGPTHHAPPSGVGVARIETAGEMLAAARDAAKDADVVIGAAAVSDFRPSVSRGEKLKRSEPSALRLDLVENPDILLEIGKLAPPGATIVGFAAETSEPVANARAKLARKGCHLVIANVVGKDRGFGSGETEVIAVTRDRDASFGPARKDQVAEFVLDQVVRLRKQPAKG